MNGSEIRFSSVWVMSRADVFRSSDLQKNAVVAYA